MQSKFFPTAPTRLKKIFSEQNLPFFGITNAHNAPALAEIYKKWLDENNHGQMQYLVNHSDKKTNPDKILPQAKSIILVGLNYYQERTNSDKKGQIARYAHGRDYHKTLFNKLKKACLELKKQYPEHDFKPNTDATPLLERHYAKEAGLGYIGKNTMLISLPYGSYFLIGEIISTKKFPESQYISPQGDCGTCTRCLDICPTGALDPQNPYKLNASKCISYLTIEHKGEIPLELRPKIGNWLFGCDLCQEVCPHNIRAQITTEPDFLKAIAGNELDLAKILTIKTDAEFLESFAGSPLMRAKKDQLIRNACIVAGNTKATKLLPLLKKLASESSPLIAEHAAWAIAEIEKST
ncbi:tRNA epoxyqueuosine(34) reductase QueG [Candidatus Gracilibacteria bacterium]|nr:tRNA epoxyqueuosine(34) reductase QueG [Candidatus Gracilibacteria bacterium]